MLFFGGRFPKKFEHLITGFLILRKRSTASISISDTSLAKSAMQRYLELQISMLETSLLLLRLFWSVSLLVSLSLVSESGELSSVVFLN